MLEIVVSLDVIDIAGELQEDLRHDIVRTRLDRGGNEIETGRSGLRGELHDVAATHAPGYCGNCYGGTPEQEGGCCNSCDEVRKAYSRRGWSFPDPEGVEQCRAEHWTEAMQVQAEEGCNVSGLLHVNKVVGNLLLSMGKTFQVQQRGSTGLVPYLQGEHMPKTHDFGHILNQFSFGGEVEFGYRHGRPKIVQNIKQRLQIRDPLEGHFAHADKGNYMYQYYLKVVPTEYHTLAGDTLTTRQYSVTAYERDLNPESEALHEARVGAGLTQKDANDAHRTFHGMRGNPSVLFNYELSAFKTVHVEMGRSLPHFLGKVCAIVGGILTLGSIVDSYFYRVKLRRYGTRAFDDGLGFASASGRFL